MDRDSSRPCSASARLDPFPTGAQAGTRHHRCAETTSSRWISVIPPPKRNRIVHCAGRADREQSIGGDRTEWQVLHSNLTPTSLAPSNVHKRPQMCIAAGPGPLGGVSGLSAEWPTAYETPMAERLAASQPSIPSGYATELALAPDLGQPRSATNEHVPLGPPRQDFEIAGLDLGVEVEHHGSRLADE